MRTHGRRATYQAGCRCDECRDVASAAKRRSRAMVRDQRRRFTSGRPEAHDPMWWADHAVCASTRPDVFFPTGSGPRLYDTAKGVCVGCPVRAECLDYAIRTSQPYGCWGGLSPEERHALKATG